MCVVTRGQRDAGRRTGVSEGPPPPVPGMWQTEGHEDLLPQEKGRVTNGHRGDENGTVRLLLGRKCDSLRAPSNPDGVDETRSGNTGVEMTSRSRLLRSSIS